MKYAVYEVYPDGKKHLWFESEDRFDCEVYINNHKYDHGIIRRKSVLVLHAGNEIEMTIEEAVKAINNNYQRVLFPGCCEGYEVRQMEKALKLLSEELKKAVERKF